MKIIAGLGNPGKKYKYTRHNAGFLFLNYLALKKDLTWKDNKKLKAKTAQNGQTLYIKPQTFMNNSGESISAVLSYYKLLSKKLSIFTTKDADLGDILTVVHDDIDIELGKYKISSNSSSAGHRGVDSIIKHLKTKKFTRIRLGIKSKQAKKIPAEKLVLKKFSSEELKIFEKTIQDIII